MKTLLTFLFLLVRPEDEATHACVIGGTTDVYLVKSPGSCNVGDKFACDFGSFGPGTLVCCSQADIGLCHLVAPEDGPCPGVDVHVCSVT